MQVRMVSAYTGAGLIDIANDLYKLSGTLLPL
jgi:hypothetical protein